MFKFFLAETVAGWYYSMLCVLCWKGTWVLWWLPSSPSSPSLWIQADWSKSLIGCNWIHSVSRFSVQTVSLLLFYYLCLTQVNYFLDNLQVLQDNPLVMAGAHFINNDNNDHVIVQTLTYSKTRWLFQTADFWSGYLKTGLHHDVMKIIYSFAREKPTPWVFSVQSENEKKWIFISLQFLLPSAAQVNGRTHWDFLLELQCQSVQESLSLLMWNGKLVQNWLMNIHLGNPSLKLLKSGQKFK